MAAQTSGKQCGRRVSVVVPVYNGAEYVSDALESVYSQTVLPDQVLVVDDGSTDDSERVLRQLENELPPSFSLITGRARGGSGGPAEPRNVGIQRSRGEFVAFLDQDDTWETTKLERQLAHFEAEPDLAVSYTAYLRVDGRSSQLVRHDNWDPDPNFALAKLMRSVAVGPPSTVLIRRSALGQVPPFDPRVGSSDDWKMWIELAAAGLRIGYLPDPLVRYRWHGSNLSSGDDRHFDNANRLFDLLFKEGRFPPHVQPQARSWRAHWHLLTAIDAAQRGDCKRARRHIARAAAARPLSIRPGWIRMLGIGRPPRHGG